MILHMIQALHLKPGHETALLNRGVSNFQLMRYNEALKDLDALLLTQPSFGEALLNRCVGNMSFFPHRHDNLLLASLCSLAIVCMCMLVR